MKIIFLVLSVTHLAWANLESSNRISIQNVIGPKQVKVKHRKQELMYGVGSELFVGDEIQTVAGQIVQLLGYDGSQWKVAPSSTLLIEDRKPEPKSFSYWVFKISGGSLWGKVVHNEKDDAFKMKIKTKSAAMGVRGTEYLVRSDATQDEVDVLEGTVLWGLSANFEPGTFVSVSAGQTASVKAGQLGKALPSLLKGDPLLHKYNLASLTESNTKTSPSAGTTHAQDCLAKGLGWRSADGSDLGECF